MFSPDVPWQRLDLAARKTPPLLTTIMAVFFSITPWPVPYLGTITPLFVLMTIYYWCSYRPDLLGSASLFFLGLLHDLVHNFPLGLSSILFIGCREAIINLRRYVSGHSFIFSWAGFSALVLIHAVLEWIVLSLYTPPLYPIVPPLMQAILTAALYPPTVAILAIIHRRVVGETS